MTALAKDRNTLMREGDFKTDAVAASVRIYAGALLMRNAAGYLTNGSTALGGVGVGRAEEPVDNRDGLDGESQVKFRPSIFRFINDAADPIDRTDIGMVCYIVDDQTVGATDGTGTRSPAGFVEGLEGASVWVRFDEALTRSA